MSDTNTPANPPAVDPFVESIASSMGIALEGIKPTDQPPADQGQAQSGVPDEKPQATQDDKPADDQKPDKPDEKTGESEAKSEQTTVGLDRALTDLSGSKPKPDAAKEKPKEPDVDPIEDSLTDEEKEELQFARYAERSGNKGAYSKTVEYFKKVQAFTKENPDADPNGDEFKALVEKHRPKYQNRSKLEREWIADQAAEKARAAIAGDAEKIKARQAELELKPKIEKVVSEFTRSMETGDLPDGVERVLTGVSEVIKKDGYEEALKRFPIEAPIVQGAVDAAEQYVRIVNGIEKFNPENPVHSWIGRFVSTQENIYMSKPEADRKSGGKTFMPGAQYAELLSTNPAEAAKHWTFSDAEILHMISVNANMVASSKIKALEQAGFQRKAPNPEKPSSQHGSQPQAAKPVQQPQATKPAQQSPRAGIAPSPGAAPAAPAAPSPNSPLLDRLVPGASKRV